MEVTEVLSVVFRWVHVVAGILWIGLLYFFNFAYTQFIATMEGESRSKVTLGLIPRTLFWFRWAALYTWVAGILLLGLIYYHGGLMFESDNLDGWSTGAIVMVVATFLLVPIYDNIAKALQGKDMRILGAVGLVVIALFVYFEVTWGRFAFRAYNIHLGVAFGSIMIMNVWQYIWPGQRKTFAALKAGSPPDPQVLARVSARSRHNTYLSVPLIWTMLNSHTAAPAADSWLYLLGSVVIGWLAVFGLYKKAAKLTGA